MRYIILAGNPHVGFGAYGPYENLEAATFERLNRFDVAPAWVLPLETPTVSGTASQPQYSEQQLLDVLDAAKRVVFMPEEGGFRDGGQSVEGAHEALDEAVQRALGTDIEYPPPFWTEEEMEAAIATNKQVTR